MARSPGEVYRVYVTPSARREAKKLPKPVREAAIEASRTMEREPFAGQRLTGSLHMLYSFHFTVGQSQYRIAYSLNHPRQLVIVHLIRSRENFYEKLKQLFK
jgi:mRNA-degrading endonuclease RelE of RelBE toxin-antitoxin system